MTTPTAPYSRTLDPAEVHEALLPDGHWHVLREPRFENVEIAEQVVPCLRALLENRTGEMLVPIDQIRGWMVQRADPR
ncbi:hypothetical protein [Parafrankia sp. EUN1f]|uniref:hypothetical protein n=1 Tax=Parafrankia sp. EUN1f TaxID=102897 RepID=UPI0001C46435|nr:hypothetical protein [Parafrankia sp. EUN1f]EFC81010.1 hypothetical protein FrEUN1fDRAFT_5889 [Parafrankia sp. EUN1f]